MKVELRIYEKSKYNSLETPKRIQMEISGYEVREISEEEMQKEGWDDFDENNEYLILHYAGSDEVGTYRNSHVDMFRI